MANALKMNVWAPAAGCALYVLVTFDITNQLRLLDFPPVPPVNASQGDVTYAATLTCNINGTLVELVKTTTPFPTIDDTSIERAAQDLVRSCEPMLNGCAFDWPLYLTIVSRAAAELCV